MQTIKAVQEYVGLIKLYEEYSKACNALQHIASDFSVGSDERFDAKIEEIKLLKTEIINLEQQHQSTIR